VIGECHDRKPCSRLLIPPATWLIDAVADEHWLFPGMARIVGVDLFPDSEARRNEAQRTIQQSWCDCLEI
jgi:hypothetical protein